MWILITILTFKILQQRELKKIINTINIKKATGADNIPAKVVRQCKVTVAQQLSSLIHFIYKHRCISRLFESSSDNSHTQEK
jgi:phosphoribosylpyrophosphate synthetase